MVILKIGAQSAGVPGPDVPSQLFERRLAVPRQQLPVTSTTRAIGALHLCTGFRAFGAVANPWLASRRNPANPCADDT